MELLLVADVDGRDHAAAGTQSDEEFVLGPRHQSQVQCRCPPAQCPALHGLQIAQCRLLQHRALVHQIDVDFMQQGIVDVDRPRDGCTGWNDRCAQHHAQPDGVGPHAQRTRGRGDRTEGPGLLQHVRHAEFAGRVGPHREIGPRIGGRGTGLQLQHRLGDRGGAGQQAPDQCQHHRPHQRPHQRPHGPGCAGRRKTQPPGGALRDAGWALAKKAVGRRQHGETVSEGSGCGVGAGAGLTGQAGAASGLECVRSCCRAAYRSGPGATGAVRAACAPANSQEPVVVNRSSRRLSHRGARGSSLQPATHLPS